MAEEKRLTGKVVNWLSHRGFGFIRETGVGIDSDVFVHYSELQDGKLILEEGDIVEFCKRTDERGRLRACKVKVIHRLDLEE